MPQSLRRITAATFAVVGIVLVGACASDDGGGHVQGGGGDARPQGVPNLFISPSGKPYRAAEGEPYPVVQWFAAANAAHDGHLTAAEFRADAERFFKELDTDHNGVIDGFEIQSYERTVAPEINPQIEGLRFGEGMDLALGRDASPNIGRGSTSRGREQAGDRRPEGAGLFGLLNEPEPVAAADTKFDGHITLDEFNAAADRRFGALDQNHLGYLTLATLPKTPAQRAIERSRAHHAKPSPPPT